MEELESGSRTDVEISASNLQLILEGKLGPHYPEIKDCYKYIKRFKKPAKHQKLVMVLDKTNVDSIVKKYQRHSPNCRKFLYGLGWDFLKEKCRILFRKLPSPSTPDFSSENFWIKQFFDFLDSERFNYVEIQKCQSCIDNKELRKTGKKLGQELSKFCKGNSMNLKRTPESGLIDVNEGPYFTYKLQTEDVFGAQVDKKGWYIWFRLSKCPEKLGIKIDTELKETEWLNDVNEFHVKVTDPRKDIARLKALFEVAYKEADRNIIHSKT